MAVWAASSRWICWLDLQLGKSLSFGKWVLYLKGKKH
jgi:hypothetical protein